MDADKRIRNVRMSEENFKEVRSLSPIEEESDSTLCFKFTSTNCTVSEPEENDRKIIEPSSEGKTKEESGDSSSEDERTGQDYYQLKRVKGSYCCFKPGISIKEAEASGDNDGAETSLRDKSLKTTVEQLKRRLSQAERKILVLTRYQNSQKCQSHERCEIFQRDLLNWRYDHEKRIDSQIVRWQLAEKRICDELENTTKVYENIQRYLKTLERQSTKSYLNFRRQIDMWEKRLKDDFVTLHENNLTELREQLRAWFEMHNVINSSNDQKEKCELCKLSNNMIVEKQDVFHDSIESEIILSYKNNAKFLHGIEQIIEFKSQQQCDDLLKRMDRKIAELWSAFEDFKHNFHLDRHYRRHNCVQINNAKTKSIVTEDSNDFTCQESTTSDLNIDSEEKYTTCS